MKTLVVLSVRALDSEFVHVTYSFNGEKYAVVMDRTKGDPSPTSVYNAVRHQHSQANGTDALIRTIPDEDHSIFTGEFVDAESPPRFAEMLVQLFAPKRAVQHLLGDLQEIFAKNCAEFGSVRATRLYWAQVLRALGPSIWRRIKRLGLIAFLIDYGRSKIGW